MNNQYAMGQQPNLSVQQNDILSIDAPAAAPVMGGQNPNVWKAKTSSKQLQYKAVVRQLPRGLEGLKNKLYPSVMVKTHYLKDKVSGADYVVKCRFTDPTAKKCPICASIGARYNAIKQAEGEEAAKAACKRLWASTEWMTNVLIRVDTLHPENNGTVKVWAHSDAVERKLDDPCRPEPAQPTSDGIPGLQKRCFIPYAPRNGVDFYVIAQYDTTKNMPSYEGCRFADAASPLASTDEEMRAILDQCHDLNEFIKDVPSEEEATATVTEFWAKVDAAARNNGGFTSFATPTAAPAPQAAPAFAAPDYNQFAQQFAAPAPAPQAFTAPAPAAAPAQAFAAPTAPAAPAAPAPQAVDPTAYFGGQQAFAQPAAPAAPVAPAPAAPVAQAFTAPAAPAAPAPAPQADPFAVPGNTSLPAGDDDDDADLPF